jgi:hypothetical protein
MLICCWSTSFDVNQRLSSYLLLHTYLFVVEPVVGCLFICHLLAMDIRYVKCWISALIDIHICTYRDIQLQTNIILTNSFIRAVNHLCNQRCICSFAHSCICKEESNESSNSAFSMEDISSQKGLFLGSLDQRFCWAFDHSREKDTEGGDNNKPCCLASYLLVCICFSCVYFQL